MPGSAAGMNRCPGAGDPCWSARHRGTRRSSTARCLAVLGAGARVSDSDAIKIRDDRRHGVARMGMVAGIGGAIFAV